MPTCSLERLQPTECPSLSLLVSVGLTARVHPPSQWWVGLGWSSAPPRPLTEKKTNNIFSFFFLFFRSERKACIRLFEIKRLRALCDVIICTIAN